MGMHVTLHGKNNTAFNGQDGSWVPVRTTTTGQLKSSIASPYVNSTASGVLSATPCTIYGYFVTAAMSAAATTVYDNASAASGTVLFIIPASTAVGQYLFPVGISTTLGAYASFAGTGTVNFLVTSGV